MADPVFIINKNSQVIRHDGCNGTPPNPANRVPLVAKNYAEAIKDAIDLVVSEYAQPLAFPEAI